MFSRFVFVVGLLLAAWMSLSGWVFGIGGDLSAWYVPTIGLTVAMTHWFIAGRLRVTVERKHRTGRGTIVALVLAWLCAIGFGFTVPNRHEGELVSIMSHLTSPENLGLSIGICNPLGIIAITLMGIALTFAALDARGPKADTDDELTPEQRAALMARPGG
ncbi:hypothetical protein [Leucobacter sp. M11]|uniref:hypothetical protein n=1 Tax=Leucobacter sp. M11 TaxID=2993565 RepID=UPI002D800DA3|nr:hypothetical protein [Leucobacter sp. M11]MEB4615130.1 hypothetical protein [Leucobacter sp. M11]